MDKPDPNGQISAEELRLRVLYAFQRTAGQLAGLFGLPLKTLEKSAHMAAFHVLRERGLDLNRIAGLLGVSRRKADQLSRLLKDNFFNRFVAPEAGEALGRRLEFLLWAQPLSAQRIKQVLPVDAAAVDGALDRLVSEGRVEVDDGRRPVYRITTPRRRLVRDHWLARVDALHHQLSTVGAAAVGRFFRDEPHAFARTVSLHVRRDQLDRLEALYRDVIWPALVELDAASEGADPKDIQALALSLCWAPADYLDALEPGAEAADDD